MAELKDRLWDETGVRSSDQYLSYQSKPLRDQATLAVYGLGGSGACDPVQPPTVTLCVRQRGGCFIVSLTILTVRFNACTFVSVNPSVDRPIDDICVRCLSTALRAYVSPLPQRTTFTH